MKAIEMSKVQGKIFVEPSSRTEYGIIRTLQGLTPFPSKIWAPFAEDDCGNFFVISKFGEVGFWDHETDKIKILAKSVVEFYEYCTPPLDVVLKEEQVTSAWIDPEFSKRTGINAPKNGWIKNKN